MMKNLIYLLLSGIFATALLLGSCEKVVYPPIEIPTDVSYSEDVQPIWDANCLDCHGGRYSPDLSVNVSYLNLMNGGYIDTDNPEESSLMQKLYEGSHDARATEAEKQIVLGWITEGAENN